MNDHLVEQKPSETALFTALRRAIANKEWHNNRFGADYLAEYFLPPHFRFFIKFQRVRSNTKAKLEAFFPGVYAYVIARTAYFDDLFRAALNEGIAQIVLLGAGYDSRAYRFAKLNQGTKIFELDIAPTQERKKKCLKSAKIDIPQQVVFVPIDFNKESLKFTLEKAGYRSDQKTLFIWEGVSYYLDPVSVEATLEILSHSSHQDSKLVFDYAILFTEENLSDQYGAKDISQSMQEKHANEGFTFLIDEGKIESFLGERNLRIVEHLDKEEIEKRCLTNNEGTSIGQIPGIFRFICVAAKR